MIAIADHGPVRELRLARPPVNALDPALIAALRAAIADAVHAGRGAIVLSGAPGRFSGGLDVPALMRLDRAALARTWTSFFGLMGDIAAAEIPVCAAMTGHSPAGGTVLAIFADYRILAEGPYLVGLNEVQVGLPVPEVIHRALTYAVGPRQAERLAVAGLLIGPDEALRVGLVDEVVALDDVVPRAVAWATDLLARPPVALAATRRQARRPLRDAFTAVDAALVDRMVDAWFSDETQGVMRDLVARLGKGKTT